MKAMRFCAFGLAAALALVNLAAAQPPRQSLPPGIKTLRDLPYVENGHERNRLDLYLPEKAPDKNSGKLPVVVWIHGGAWQGGNKDNCPAEWLTDKGYAVASINYRLTQHAVFPAQINDCKAAIRWLRAHAAKYHLDPDHIGAWGASAGGHLVAMLGTTGGVKELEGDGGNLDQSSRVQCVVDWFGPTDLTTMGAQADKPIAQLIGGPVQDNKEKVRKASPLTYVSKDSAPFLIMHGDQDDVVPLQQSKILAEALKKAGVEVKLQIIEGNKHGGPGFSTPESRKLIEEFFEKHLKGKSTPAKAASQESAKPRVLVTISKETTYITSPLRKDGYPDYLAALNERCKKGVTPENNAAVLFWQAVGPSEIMPQMCAQHFRMLEMSQPAEKGDYFVSFDHYMQRLKDAGDPRLPAPATDGNDSGWDQLTQSMRRPWSKQEFPILAEWLAANERPLVLLIKASKRPRWYDPMLGSLTAMLSDGARQSREVGRALASRAMMRLKDGQRDDAWNDLLACRQLARLVGQGVSLIDVLIALDLDGKACAGDQALFKSDSLSVARIAKMREDLDRLTPIPKMVDRIDVAERLMFLDSVAAIARNNTGLTGLLQGDVNLVAVNNSFFDNALGAATDWDAILRMGNSLYDRIVTATRKNSFREKRGDLETIEKEIKARAADARDPKAFGVSLLTNGPQLAVSQRLGNAFIALLSPAICAAINCEDREIMRAQIDHLGFGLAAYHADHGTYPDKLEELAPLYVAKVPTDIFANDGPLHYQRQGKGYLLYSVGINGRDDGGKGYDDRKNGEDWDDVSVRVP